MIRIVPKIAREIPPATRINVGSGQHPLLNWCNLDNDPASFADLFITVPPIPYSDESLDEIYAGHFLEHLETEEASEFMDECWRSLKVGGRLGIVVPDIREVMRRFLDPKSNARVEYPRGVWRDCHDLEQVCDLFLYSTAQESHHKWMYDRETLGKLMVKHGFQVTGPINPWLDPRIPVGAWYQFGLDAIKLDVR